MIKNIIKYIFKFDVTSDCPSQIDAIKSFIYGLPFKSEIISKSLVILDKKKLGYFVSLNYKNLIKKLVINEYSLISWGTELAYFENNVNTNLKYPLRFGYSSVGKINKYVFHRGKHKHVDNINEYWIIPKCNSHEVKYYTFTYLLTIAINGFNKGFENKKYDQVFILGNGIIGQLLALYISKKYPYTRIKIFTRNDNNWVYAKNITYDRIKNLCNTYNNIYVIDTTGSNTVIIEIVKHLKESTYNLLGSPRGLTNILVIKYLSENNINIVGSHISELQNKKDDHKNIVNESIRFINKYIEDIKKVKHSVIDIKDLQKYFENKIKSNYIIDWSNEETIKSKSIFKDLQYLRDNNTVQLKNNELY